MIIVYLLGTASVLLATWLLVRNWHEISNLPVDRHVDTLGSIFQLAVVGAGVVVAVETLRSSGEALDYQRQARTNQLFDEVSIDDLYETASKIRDLLRLNYDPSHELGLKNEDRIVKIAALLEDESFRRQTAAFENAMMRLRRCADSGECSERRVKNLMCALSDDSIRNDARSLRVKLDHRFNGRVGILSHNMSQLQIDSCGRVHAGIDYLCERYLSC